MSREFPSEPSTEVVVKFHPDIEANRLLIVQADGIVMFGRGRAREVANAILALTGSDEGWGGNER